MADNKPINETGIIHCSVPLTHNNHTNFCAGPCQPACTKRVCYGYDAGRGVVVLFGGQDTASMNLGDTWEWANGSWSQININGPSARINAAMAYDSDQKKIVLFGGRSKTGSGNDLWAYDGKSWVKQAPSSSPPPRQLGTMAYDKSLYQLVLFGGMNPDRKSIGDTWVLKDNQWTELKTKSPSARASHCMTYNDNSGAVCVYGGYVDGNGVNDFWELKDGTWKDVTDKNGPGRIHASICYDKDKDRMLLFGGFNDAGRTNELWEYSNNKWAMIHPDGPVPDPRAEHRSVFIPGKGLFVFGGVIGVDPNTRNRGNDTWLYHENSWTKLN